MPIALTAKFVCDYCGEETNELSRTVRRGSVRTNLIKKRLSVLVRVPGLPLPIGWGLERSKDRYGPTYNTLCPECVRKAPLHGRYVNHVNS